ncbi:MAG TPA: 3-oxoacyl-ACP synthase [Deltaproteobacteria bacterium]|nr:MAG: 3-oxoacyl-ACP synthase [Deltaproteobacteria bacterium GWA2_55_82]OGQ63885.1 MAG: 3-oxoacyl-ACP synthase [Deltaproteobacteria bacterium RIFCSPLOWO2_02_FULL_55_12]OIJ72653.1 MAG: 3-oxoacyl-ACP synthase [Deltaproteobacteria bacterium GWC2_55_46]HBG47555.1 3-oxoacyl-ACP synthase [Deltaproteobacteria bacterium]HCY10466.1 3-oxoacyl-ACP synthase [Deltaproteobacteria bacterium]
MLRSRVIGTGSYVPARVLTNHDLEKMVETSDDWIATRTGIKERRIAVDEPTSDMASKAAKAALKAAGVQAKDIDLVVVGTVTPDMAFPSTACSVQSQLGIRAGAAAFDVSAACSGFLYALDIADKYLKSGGAKKALVIGVDRFSKLIDWKDRTTCVLFGDGAGAVVLSAEKGSKGVLSTRIHSDGRHWDMLYCKSTCPPNPFEEGAGPEYLVMNGNETFKLAVRTMGQAIKEVMEETGLTSEDISLLIPHQANMRIINAARERLHLTEDRVFTNLERYGNTSAGSIPIALDEAVREGKVKDNDIVLFVAFGGGLTWASAALRW